MRRKLVPILVSTAVTAVMLIGLAVVGPVHALAQAKPAVPPSDSAKRWTPPRTPSGQPDLQGVWSFSTATPFERAADLADKEFLTAEEAAAYAKKIVEARNKDTRGDNAQSDVEAAYNDFWWDQGTQMGGTRRTSLVIDPKNGKIPPLTPAGQKRAADSAANWVGAPDGPEDRSLGERCLMGFNAGPPMAPSAYNNNVHILQTPDHVALLNEMIHNTRIVPLNAHPALPERVRLWAGESKGHWEGDTLVVVTTNFRPEGTGQVALRGSSGDQMKLTERFTRSGPNDLIYEFTVDDPGTWVRPWTVQMPMTRSDEPIYEYACHEGNYGMMNMLSGARAKERAADSSSPH
ncbi:MAG: hypothetical protein ABL961_10080 [Vicinamibacterales bacterium]